MLMLSIEEHGTEIKDRAVFLGQFLRIFEVSCPHVFSPMQDSKVCSVFWFKSLAYPASSTTTDFTRHRKVDACDVSPCNIVERTPGRQYLLVRRWLIFFDSEHDINPSPILPQVFFPNHEQPFFWLCCWYLRIDIAIIEKEMYKNMSDSSLDDLYHIKKRQRQIRWGKRKWPN